MRRTRLVLASAILVGCSSGGPVGPTPTVEPSASPTETATSTPAPTSVPNATSGPSVPTEPTPVPEPTPSTGPCPTGSQLTVRQFVDADPACFGGADLQIRGWLDTPPPLGFENVIEPAWLWYPTDSAATLWFGVPQGEHICDRDRDGWCSWFFPHVAPDSTASLLPLKRWVILTGHTHDPAAETCRYGGDAGPAPDLVAACRTNFVVTAIRPAS